MNRKFLQEAIADAKAVKESAIANAKVALEEAFSPQLQAMFASKLEEMDEVNEEKVEIDETEEINEGEMEESMEELDEKESIYQEDMEEEINLDEILAELEKDEVEESKEDITEVEETEEEEMEDESDEEEVEMESDEEEIDIEDMSENDLKKFIEGVIADMVEAGELEAGEEMKSEEVEDDKEMEMDMEMDMEVDVEDEAEITKKKDEEEKMMEMKSDLEESIEVIKTLKIELNEINLLNAKLLYSNKIFKSKNMTESQKTKVLSAFDKANDVKTVKLVFETISENLVSNPKPVRESLRGSASKTTIVPNATKQPIMESDLMVQRFKKLAGII